MCLYSVGQGFGKWVNRGGGEKLRQGMIDTWGLEPSGAYSLTCRVPGLGRLGDRQSTCHGLPMRLGFLTTWRPQVVRLLTWLPSTPTTSVPANKAEAAPPFTPRPRKSSIILHTLLVKAVTTPPRFKVRDILPREMSRNLGAKFRGVCGRDCLRRVCPVSCRTQRENISGIITSVERSRTRKSASCVIAFM